MGFVIYLDFSGFIFLIMGRKKIEMNVPNFTYAFEIKKKGSFFFYVIWGVLIVSWYFNNFHVVQA